ncbi:MAG: HAD family phosphatase [Deltaproteobacteria bacterium]|nr:HAD family phosphatase [Deltaproteobacteria bacterium]
MEGLASDRIDAVFADMGDTLIRIRPDRFFDRLREHVPDLDTEAFYREVLYRDVYRDFARGFIDGPAFCERMGGILGARWDFETFRDVWCDMMDEIPGTREAFRKAQEHMPVYVLSNTDPVHVAHILERFPWIGEARGLFLSCDEGLLKPDPSFYSRALERFGHDPRAVVFIDDRMENVQAAREAGMQGVHMRDAGTFVGLVEHLWG